MGVFTPELYKVLAFEHDAGDGMRIGLDDYPIFDPAHRAVLNALIIDEYQHREIGLESIPLFVHRLRLKMRQIMPYYNQLYATEHLLLGKELSTFDLTTVKDDTSTEHGTTDANLTSKVTSTSGARNVNSDTPETPLSGDEDYATSLADVNSTAENDTTSTQGNTTDNTGTLNGTTTTNGYQGAASDLLNKYRATLLNIDMMIVPQLNELFMLVRGNGSEMLPHRFDDDTYSLPSLGF
jgi:hypothetical protein